MNEYFNEEKNGSKITCNVQKYTDIYPDSQDLLKEITLNVSYKVNGKERSIEMKKIKIKE